MNIIILGPPGAGKGTQINYISYMFNIPKISIGNILRNIFNKKNNNLYNTINNGNLVHSKIIFLLLKKILKKKNVINNFIIDGFPRNKEQIIIIKKLKIKINLVIELILNLKNIQNRLLGRMIHFKSGRTYHNIYNPPIINNRDNITNEKIVKRLDDNTEVIKKRFIEYNKEINIVRNFFKKENIIYKQINANLSIKEINKKIKKIILDNKLKT